MKKRLISFLLLFAFAINLLPLSGCKNLGGGFVTRGEWITMLSSAFGMNSYTVDTPFYSDVPVDSELFAYVQSAAEWQVLDVFSGDKIGVDKAVTCEQVAGTAAVAAGFESAGEVFDSTAALAYAREKGIVAMDKKPTRKMTQEDCQAAISAAQKIYLSMPMSTEEKITAALNEEIVNLSNVAPDKISVGDSQVTFPNEGGTISQNESGETTAEVETESGNAQVKVGDIFTTPPTPEHPFGVAYKVIGIREENGELIIETEAPTLADLYDELSIHTTVSADPANIIWADSVVDAGSAIVEASATGEGFTIQFLAANKDPIQAVPMASNSFSKDFSFGNGSFKSNWSNKTPSVLGSGEGAQAFSKSNFAYDGNPSIEDFGGSTDSWAKDLAVENNFSGGYKITGNITIRTLDVRTDVEYNKLWVVPVGIKTASVQVDSSISSTLRMEGQLAENLKIATIPIPIAATGLSVTVEFYLYANASGHLEVKAEISNSARVEYANQNIRTSANSSANTSAEAAIEVDFGADLRATLDAIGIIKIMDAGAKAGGELTAGAGIKGSCKATKADGEEKLTYQESMSIKADLYAPIVDVYTGGSNTLISSLGLNKTWNIITRDKAAHFTIIDYEWVFWEETVLNDKNGETQTEETTAGEKDGIGSTDESRLSLTTYVITLTDGARRIELDVLEGETIPAVVWSSDNSSVATVDETGLVTPAGGGATIITVQLQEDPNIYAKCAVYVEKAEENHWEFLPPDMPVSA